MLQDNTRLEICKHVFFEIGSELQKSRHSQQYWFSFSGFYALVRCLLTFLKLPPSHFLPLMYSEIHRSKFDAQESHPTLTLIRVSGLKVARFLTKVISWELFEYSKRNKPDSPHTNIRKRGHQKCARTKYEEKMRSELETLSNEYRINWVILENIIRTRWTFSQNEKTIVWESVLKNFFLKIYKGVQTKYWLVGRSAHQGFGLNRRAYDFE